MGGVSTSRRRADVIQAARALREEYRGVTVSYTTAKRRRAHEALWAAVDAMAGEESEPAARAIEFAGYLADAADQVAGMFAKGEEQDHDTARDVLGSLASAAYEFRKRAARAVRELLADREALRQGGRS